MNYANYLLQINTPCQENWDIMKPDTQGRFCNSCSKQVVDFTGLSDSEIINLISRAKGSICGRLMESQINRELITETERSQIKPFNPIMAGLVFLSLAEQASAQQHVDSPDALSKTSLQQFVLPPINFIHNHVMTADTVIHIINGQILDSVNSYPLSGVSVLIKGTNVGVLTNDKGFFELNVPDNLVADSILLSVSYIGYKHDTLVINSHNARSNQFFLKQVDMLMGDVVIVRVQKKKWWKFWK